MRIFLSFYFLIGLSSAVFSLKSNVSTFIQSTCPAVQEKLNEVEKSYNGLFYFCYLNKATMCNDLALKLKKFQP